VTGHVVNHDRMFRMSLLYVVFYVCKPDNRPQEVSELRFDPGITVACDQTVRMDSMEIEFKHK
jgi:hypothetical protein